MNLVSSEEKYRTPIFTVTEDHAVEPGGFEIKREIVRHKGSAVMMAVDDHDRILLVRQYRLPAQRFLWELPAGKLDDGETAVVAAQRELVEETGYRAAEWTLLQSFYPSPGYVSELMTIFLAKKLTPGQAKPMEDERIESKWFTPTEIAQMIESGEIIDSKTLIGYYRWLSRKTES